MPRVNAVGELVLTDAREFRALTEPLALTLTDRLRRDGPATTATLSHRARAAGLFNARVALTADELRTVQEDLERLLAPYLTRAADDTPPNARNVRILGYFLPGAEPPRPR
jgi:hypothetical protein